MKKNKYKIELSDEIEDFDLEEMDDNIPKPVNGLTDKEKSTIAEKNMKLIDYVCHRLITPNTSYEELFSVGLIGYAKALDRYDKSRNVKFSTYAYNCINNEILFFLRKENKHVQYNVSLNKILSIDKNGNNLQLEEIISDKNQGKKTLEDNLLDEENKEYLKKIIEKFKPEEQYIITYRYGLDNGRIKTQKQIAEDINMSQANVSKIQKNCLNKLKKILRNSTN